MITDTEYHKKIKLAEGQLFKRFEKNGKVKELMEYLT